MVGIVGIEVPVLVASTIDGERAARGVPVGDVRFHLVDVDVQRRVGFVGAGVTESSGGGDDDQGADGEREPDRAGRDQGAPGNAVPSSVSGLGASPWVSAADVAAGNT